MAKSNNGVHHTNGNSNPQGTPIGGSGQLHGEAVPGTLPVRPDEGPNRPDAGVSDSRVEGQDLAEGRDYQTRDGVAPQSPDGCWHNIGPKLRHVTSSYGPADDQIHKLCPWLAGHLTHTHFPSGKSREPAYIKIVGVTGEWAATLYDLSIGHKLTVRFQDLLKLAETFEATLRRSDCPWEKIAFGEAAEERKRLEKESFERKTRLTGRPV